MKPALAGKTPERPPTGYDAFYFVCGYVEFNAMPGTWIGGIIAENLVSQEYTNSVTLDDGRTMSIMAEKGHQNRNELTNQGMFASSGIGLGGGPGMQLTAVGWRELVG